MDETIFLHRYESPLGVYILVSSDEGLACVKPEEQSFPDLDKWERQGAPFEEGGTTQAARRLLRGRAHGLRRAAGHAGNALPASRVAGADRSYGEVAAGIGMPTASRAVGSANGSNPVSIIGDVPPTAPSGMLVG